MIHRFYMPSARIRYIDSVHLKLGMEEFDEFVIEIQKPKSDLIKIRFQNPPMLNV